MSNHLVKEKGIVNPFAKMVLTLSVDDQGQVTLNSSLHPQEACKLLRNIEADLLFKYIDSVTQANQQTGSLIEKPVN